MVVVLWSRLEPAGPVNDGKRENGRYEDIGVDE
jgi:hypothetical protein